MDKINEKMIKCHKIVEYYAKEKKYRRINNEEKLLVS